MKLLIEDKLNEIFGIHDAPTVADKGEIETLILKALEESEKVIAFYSDAWKRLPVVRKRAREKGLNYHLYMPVDPLEVKLAYPLDAKALFEAKKSFMLSIKPHRAQKTLSLTKPVSRRNLLRRPLDSVMVYRAVPVIASTPCFQQQHCNACITSCPFQALSGKPPRVDPAKCTSCGLCMGSCPFGFIEMTGLGFEALDYMLAVIRRNLDKPGHMVFSCWDSLPDIANLSASTPTFFVGIECPGWVVQQSIILAVSQGFHVSVFCSDSIAQRCGGEREVEKWLKELEGFPVYPRIVKNAARLGKVLSSSPSASTVLPRGTGRVEAIHKLSEAYNLDSLELSSPLAAIVEVDPDKCPLCEGCSSSCPYGALETRVEDDRIMLLFRHDLCQSCLICEEVCPYDALKLRYGYSRGLYRRELLLAEDKVARCKMCGKPLGSVKILLETEKRLREHNVAEWVIEQLWLCPECKIKGLSKKTSS